ncbi:hypothetical protein ACD591_17180 [Rufibacter glacialis]|uniref:Uncharacterized protein n=1 Tax=Rufibacter glacialis TaxID=1259555 RepID=A0A5M8QE57_9BACT|nr:hypothetical protein [Rufibacter glacialis]KAA6434317.1 hypothetical protein FOE74_08915 [Rufibacter glacialis]GGK68515.1 hypothetical protein GCM10011405_15760 [Rufibacter glacialis]
MLPPEDDEGFTVPEQLPLYQKGREIYSLTKKIAGLIEEEDEVLSSLKECMLFDASLLTVKVAGAEAADLYDLRMENATFIRKAALDLLSHCTSLEMFGYRDTHYLPLLREALEEYRFLFIDWVQGFDPWNYVNDRWGLFNPPGVQAQDPDDDSF